jgi:hypothetical protein
VTDASGSVLPGVTVEASSPALIEKVRAVVTDGTGQYRIVDLRPGVYTVIFQLPSFSTVRRDGIELTVGFTATVNAEMRMGTVEETITVEGSSPIVDIQNVNQIKVVNRELTILTGRGFANFATLIPGVNMSNSSLNISQDVGGGTGYNFAFAAIHGGRAMDQQVMVNGMSVTSLTVRRDPPRSRALAARGARLSRSGGPRLEGSVAAPRCGVRLVRNRTHSVEILDEPVRVAGRQEQHEQRSPGHCGNQQRQPHVDRLQQGLRRAG